MDLFSLPRCRMDTCETKTSETFAPLGRFNDFSSLVSLSAKVPALQFTRSARVHIDMSKVPTIQQSPLQQILKSPGLTLNLLKPKSFLGISGSTSRLIRQPPEARAIWSSAVYRSSQRRHPHQLRRKRQSDKMFIQCTMMYNDVQWCTIYNYFIPIKSY